MTATASPERLPFMTEGSHGWWTEQLTLVPYGSYLSPAQSVGPGQVKNTFCIGASVFPLSDERMLPSLSAGEGSLSCLLD